MSTRIPQLLAAILGLSGVGLGAFGAHALRPRLNASGHLETWQTAVQYHLIHAVAVLAAALFIRFAGAAGRDAGHNDLRRAAWCWTAGVFLFSGSLYWLSLGGPRWLGPVTPLGGVFLLAGWAMLLLRPGSRSPHSTPR